MHSTNQIVCPLREMFENTTAVNRSSIMNASHEIYCPCPHKAIKTLDLDQILSSVLFLFANAFYVLHATSNYKGIFKHIYNGENLNRKFIAPTRVQNHIEKPLTILSWYMQFNKNWQG